MDEIPVDHRPRRTIGGKVVLLVISALIALLIARNLIVQTALSLHRPLGLSDLIVQQDAALLMQERGVVVSQIDWQKHTPDDMLALAKQAHRLDPLDNWPLFLLGSVQEHGENRDRAIASFRKSIRRDPRSPAPRLHLIQNLIQARQGDEALTEIVRLARLSPAQDKVLLPALISLLIQDPEHRLVARLKDYPDVRNRLITQASLTEGAEPFLAELLAQPGVDKKMRWEQIGLLAKRGAVAAAFELWRRQPEAGSSIIFDSTFSGRQAPEPFRWRLINDSSVVSEIMAFQGRGEPALDVEVFGDTLALATVQLVRIPAGAHRLAVTGIAIDPPERGGTMRWDVKCIGAEKPIARIVFPMTPKPTTRRASFEIPAQGCAFQEISLTGVPVDRAQPFRMRFTRIVLD